LTITVIRQPDNPSLVSLNFLQQIDSEATGLWTAQSKLNGWRRTAWRIDGAWQFSAKHKTGPAARPLPKELIAEFASIEWPECDVLALDMEWVGPRGGGDSLHIFDLLSCKHGWLGNTAFTARHLMLERIMSGQQTKAIRLVPYWSNPGLGEKFMEQLQHPYSEGLVIRRADSGLIGAFDKCANNPHWFKVKFQTAKEVV